VNTLKRARYDAGLSLDQLAAASGVASEHLSRIENGKTFPNAPTAKKIADALSLKPSEIFFDDAPIESAEAAA
jgi:transcriptional regulator with XRE-family HTH domain